MNVSQLLKEQVLSSIQSVSSTLVLELKPIEEPRIRLEYSRDEKFGDYSTSYALENKKIFKRNPMEVANLFVENLSKFAISKILFKQVTITVPGFVNFRINESFLKTYLNLTLLSGDYFAQSPEQKKINLEFVSANPTGPLNIVSARAASFGDALASILTTLGHKVEREFYVNDYGNQVELLGVAVLLRFRELQGYKLSYQEEDDGRNLKELILSHTLPKESYRGEYITDIARKLSFHNDLIQNIQESYNSTDFESIIDSLASFAVHYNLEVQKSDLLNFGIKFDRFFSERSLHESGDVLGVLKELEKSGKIFVLDGKKLFKSTDFGDDKDRVVVRDDFRPTYLLADISYHKNKINRGYDEIIDIWGPDHHGYIARLSGAMQSLNFPRENFHVIICQQVNLLEDGLKVKMSKRLGNFQRMSDLIHYLGNSARDVGRYFFITRTAESPLDFDLDLAKDSSDKNPVFYLQYAHARICSIFNEVGDEYNPEWFEQFVWTEERRNLLFWVSRFPEEVYDAAINREPHRITTYLQFLCKAFTKFYTAKENRLKESDDAVRGQLAYLCKVTQLVIRSGLDLLGISVPIRMDHSNES